MSARQKTPGQRYAGGFRKCVAPIHPEITEEGFDQVFNSSTPNGTPARPTSRLSAPRMGARAGSL